MSQQSLASRVAMLGYNLTRATLAKIEAEIRAVSEIELFIIAQALRVPLVELYPEGLLEMIREGKVAPFHVRKKARKAKGTTRKAR
jgi:transcriptional regulator with XRE-family HTH domain